ncbi:MAG TPA: hypothetical protein VMW78_10175 [Anaerolineae bacterium]|nr:hypothetical protein [Anaerolineae bacterium]
MRKFKITFFCLICLIWTFNCYGRFETVKHNESQSASIFEQKCSNCHEANERTMLLTDDKSWKNTIYRMSRKQGAEVTKSDVEKLISMHVESQKAEKDFFLKECTHCHGEGTSLSDIKTKQEWKETIRRMMAKAQKNINDDKINLLISYHVRHQNIIMTKCSRCHDLKRIVTLDRDEESWRETVTAMSKEKGSDISEDEINIIVRYHRQRQKKDQELFETKCLKCHKRMNMQSPPEVEKTPDEWGATIRRMMKKINEVISNENINTLTHYHIRTHSMITFEKLKNQSEIFSLDSAELFKRKCSTCHSLERSLNALQDKEAWEKTIRAMAKKDGSTITESDISELVNFITLHGQ